MTRPEQYPFISFEFDISRLTPVAPDQRHLSPGGGGHGRFDRVESYMDSTDLST
jgi:hypothetical protein